MQSSYDIDPFIRILKLFPQKLDVQLFSMKCEAQILTTLILLFRIDVEVDMLKNNHIFIYIFSI